MGTWIPTIKKLTESEELYKSGNTTIRAEAQALMIRFPFGGFVWNRPTAVLISEGDNEQRYPIVDVSRIAVWAIAGFGLVISSSIIFLKFISLLSHKE